MAEFFKINDNSEPTFSSEGLAKLSVRGREFCIAQYQDKLLACAAKCPHAGGDLSEGYIDSKGNIVCPTHGYKFSLLTGRNVSGEGYSLKIHPVTEKSGEIFISVE